jgi:hypothetical protein
MAAERVLLDQATDRASTAAPRAAEPQAFAGAIGNQAFGRLMAAGHPVLARTMAAKVSFTGHFPEGSDVTPAKLRAIHAELTQAWTDIQADPIQVSFMSDGAKARVAAWFTAYGTAMTALLAEIQNGNPADPEQVGVGLDAVKAPGDVVLAQRFSAALSPLSNVRGTLNKAWDDWDANRKSKYDESTEKQMATAVPAAAAAPQREDYSSWPLRYDEHGDKHFRGQDSQWVDDKNPTLRKMEDAIRGVMDDLPAVTARYYEIYPRTKINRGPAALYYTLQDRRTVGHLGGKKGPPTTVWTIQVDVYPHLRTIVYHGYPDEEDVEIGLKTSK